MPLTRLFVILARRAPRAIILRRRPSDWYHLVLWNTAKNTFEYGAWFRGRIYEERCDLSPDGELFVYFALQGSRFRTSYRGSWTAVSRPPWLHALILWQQGDTWGGGGRFADDRKLVLANGLVTPHPDHPVRGLEVSVGPCAEQRSDGLVADADWSGRDHDGRCIYTRGGKLWRRGARADVELADFNALKPAPVAAPLWAKRPLPTANGLARKPRRVRGKKA